jgi:hypothetical protein
MFGCTLLCAVVRILVSGMNLTAKMNSVYFDSDFAGPFIQGNKFDIRVDSDWFQILDVKFPYFGSNAGKCKLL